MEAGKRTARIPARRVNPTDVDPLLSLHEHARRPLTMPSTLEPPRSVPAQDEADALFEEARRRQRRRRRGIAIVLLGAALATALLLQVGGSGPKPPRSGARPGTRAQPCGCERSAGAPSDPELGGQLRGGSHLGQSQGWLGAAARIVRHGNFHAAHGSPTRRTAGAAGQRCRTHRPSWPRAQDAASAYASKNYVLQLRRSAISSGPRCL